jgi:uncharacterized membrane protein YhaH (DUF805 family)
MNWYLDIVLNKYADFTGRAGRKEYWMFQLFNVIVAAGNGFVLGFVSRVFKLEPVFADMGIVIYMLAMLPPSVAVAIRRMHDVGRRGWWVLCPGINLLLLFLDSEPGTNEYGPNPKAYNPQVVRPSYA